MQKQQGRTNLFYLPKNYRKGKGKERGEQKKGEQKVLSFHLSAPGLNNPTDSITQ